MGKVGVKMLVSLCGLCLGSLLVFSMPEALQFCLDDLIFAELCTGSTAREHF